MGQKRNCVKVKGRYRNVGQDGSPRRHTENRQVGAIDVKVLKDVGVALHSSGSK
jgi:hypothetical protein